MVQEGREVFSVSSDGGCVAALYAMAAAPTIGKRRPKHRRSLSTPLQQLDTSFSFRQQLDTSFSFRQDVESPRFSSPRMVVGGDTTAREVDVVPGFPQVRLCSLLLAVLFPPSRSRRLTVIGDRLKQRSQHAALTLLRSPLTSFPPLQVPAHWATPDSVWVTEPSMNVHVAAWFPCPEAAADAPAGIAELREASQRFSVAIETKSRKHRESQAEPADAHAPKPPTDFVSMILRTFSPSLLQQNAVDRRGAAEDTGTFSATQSSPPSCSLHRRATMDERLNSTPVAVHRRSPYMTPVRVKSFSSGCPVATNKKFGMLDALHYYTVRCRPRVDLTVNSCAAEAAPPVVPPEHGESGAADGESMMPLPP